MTLSDVSIKNPVFAWMLMIGLMAFGWIGFHRMGISQLPDVDFPVVTITVTWEDAAPEIMETQVADIIEDAVMSVEGIQDVYSTSSLGQTQITVEFNLSRSIDVAVQDIQSHIAQAQKNLPQQIDPPIIQKINPEDQPIIWLVLKSKPGSDVSLTELCRYINEHLKDQLAMVPGVGNIGLGGYIDPNLRIWLDADKMAKREITVEDILDGINTEHADVPAGYIDNGPKEYNVRVYGEAYSPEEFSHLVIPNRVRGGSRYKTFRFSDVAIIEDGLNDIRRISRAKGQTAVGMGIIKQRGTNAVAVADAVKKKIKELQATLPQGMMIELVFDSSDFIKDSVHELDSELMRSVVLTSLVCLLFLGSWSATLNVLLAIPTAILGTFIVLYFMGFTINSFTMLGLSLVIGIIVDDAIMVLENIARYREEGLPKVRAALIGAREITSAAMAASIAILAIFIPVIFMQGIVGKFFFQFGVTISVAVMISLVEALTIAPMRCSQFLEVGRSNALTRFMDDFMNRLKRGYRRGLERCLNNPKTVLAGALLVFLASLSLLKPLKKEFIPSQDMSRVMVSVTLPLGVSLDQTDQLFKTQIEPWVNAQPEVDLAYAIVGGFNNGGVNAAGMMVTMKPKDKRPRIGADRHLETQSDFMGILRKKIGAMPGIDRVSVLDLSQQGFSAKRGYPVQFMIQGPEWGKLAEVAAQFRQKMKDSGLMGDIDTDYNPGMPEIQVHPDRAKTAETGITALAIGSTVNAMFGGLKFGKFTGRGKRYDVRVRLADKDRHTPKDLSRIWVRNNFGQVIPLNDVVKSEIKPALFAITRYNRERSITVYANPTKGSSQGEALDAVNKIAKQILPEGYHIIMAGNSQLFSDSFKSLGFVLMLGIFVAYMVLATQFNSFIHPVTVLLALPFSVTGALLALFITHQSLNIYSMIGLILLMGIVKKNSILLVDFTIERRKHGLSLREALLEACPIRLRPIVMTSVATVAGALPVALATGVGSELMVPMAVTIVGGVTVSTFLTLFVVPCFYQVMARFESHAHDQELKEALVELGELPGTDGQKEAASLRLPEPPVGAPL
jgi:HAE1 family hydrophobic/amphiphilic exporter-1